MKIIQHKYRKYHKVKVQPDSVDYKRIRLQYGFIGLIAQKSYLIRPGEIESIKRTIKKVLKKDGSLHIRPVLDRPVTSKPAEVRMGKGKGSFKENVGVIGKGTVILELSGASLKKTLAVKALEIVKKKLSVPTKLIFYQN